MTPSPELDELGKGEALATGGLWASGLLDREELESLRSQLVRIGPDYCGASEVIRAFLTGRGFGISPEAARTAALEFGRQGCTMHGIERALAVAAQIN